MPRCAACADAPSPRGRTALLTNRRAFLGMLGLIIAPRMTEAQQAVKVARVGVLANNPDANPHMVEAFLQALRDFGYVEGRDLVMEYRSAEGKLERYPALAAELVALKVDIIVAGNATAALAAKQATRTLPIVFVAESADPVASGLVTSVARPGGNVTGLTGLAPDSSASVWSSSSRPFRGSVISLSSGSQVPATNARKRTS